MVKNGRRMVFFCMHPLNNVPPPLNAAIYFGDLGYQVIVVCYYDKGLPRFERLGKGARLLRIDLRSRTLRVTVLRYICAVIEFLWKSAGIVKRIKPDIIITFNEIASMLHGTVLRRYKHSTRMAWLLEFPENLERSLGKSLLFRYSVRSWKYADLIVAPTRERLAMACVLQPGLI